MRRASGATRRQWNSVVLWDFDGTIASTWEDIYFTLNEVGKNMGWNIPDSVRTESAYRILSAEDIASKVVPEAGDTDLCKFASLVRTHYRKENPFNSTQMYPGLQMLLSNLNDVGCASYIVTAKPREALERILRVKHWSHYFASWYCLEETDELADKQQLVSRVVKEHQESTNKFKLIGDSFNDMQAACSNGIPFIAALYGEGDLNFDDPRQRSCLMSASQSICLARSPRDLKKFFSGELEELRDDI
ncbi:HAD family hydrolase [Corynebacterium glucuronolyticum]|uniref:HAD family hydrolase n=1 Tax=Corynebacterium glucuronolyticum TaxID=39791 RepID=UPI00019C1ACC|nr:HAD hydrolase-like protein [Corynebacterium glucuronolyticum]EEI27847.1 haloacid dehalogenase-like hydrolase [Corynebacterium glucuronolyticum ATCC 51867]QRO82098.1 HAD family hydrolase [Corynebacterium glucuronolyticum]